MNQRNLWKTLVFGLLAVCAAPLMAQDSDITPPSLIEFDFNPKSINVTAGPQSVTVTGRVTDDLAGVFGFSVIFTSPGNGQSHSGFVGGLLAGGPLDGTFEGFVEIPEFAESGTWKASVFLQDAAGNAVSLSDANLAAASFPIDLEVVSIADTTPPTIADITLTPGVINVSSGDQVLTVEFRLTDDVSGVDLNSPNAFFPVTFRSPVGQQRHLLAAPNFMLDSGTALDGRWTAEWTVPQYSQDGEWTLAIVTFADRAGNVLRVTRATLINMGLASTFTVVSVPDDTTAPQISGLTFTPSVIDTSAGPQTVSVSMDLSDDLAGVDFSLDSSFGGFTHGIQFDSPSGGQSRSACCGGFNLVSGTSLNGTWEGTAFFPQFSEAGTWKASLVQVSDRTHNWLRMDPDELASAGLPSDLVIVRPSLVGDGTIGTGGGTVEDETFGAQAQVTFPPGAVAEDTEVSIDVFESPLDIPTPTGFQGFGTNFVNVNLDPVPSYPFPSPGVTLVLPLAGPELLPVGFTIPLYFVDPATGGLTPMLDLSGSPVIGTVDPGSLTATFTGISHFTIVVGLIPDVIQVTIDIKPSEGGNGSNPINTKSRGKIPVAILSTEGFDAVTEIDQRTLTFGKTGDELSLSHCNGNGEDVGSDGLRDLVCHFNTQATGFALGDTQGVLKGETWSGMNIVGSDSVRILK